ncbi:Conserved_hypothetical protein [Hexamita inflata]|uniref:Uncharacterized protein n=1 Tax=Hexamita inflata TaxID=28002 RepID=A0AA86R2K7_9EUKA|nr:Conserved hypothetical protein [Hexamita inflata]
MVRGALICQVCDVKVDKSTLIFIASGTTLSGLIYQAIEQILIHDCSLQYRFVCNYSSGIVNYINNGITIFQIVKVSLLGRNILSNQISGYIASLNNASVNINYVNFQACTEEQEFGENSGSVHITGSVNKDCRDVCSSGIPTYGLCLEDLLYGRIVDFQNVCFDPFEFMNHTCVCKYGYILNQSLCVNVVDSLINLDQQLLLNISAVNKSIGNNFAALNKQLTSNQSQLENTLLNMNQQLQLSISTLRTDLDSNIQLQTSYLENMIQQNITLENQLFFDYFSKLKYDYLNNFTFINQNIISLQNVASSDSTNNISFLNNTIMSQYVSLDDLIYQKSNYIQFYLNNSQQLTDQNRISKMNQLTKYIIDNVTKFNTYNTELQLNLSNRVTLTANYIKQNYTQLQNYIQGTFANYDYLKQKCNAGSICSNITYYQRRNPSCPEKLIPAYGEIKNGDSYSPCELLFRVNYAQFQNFDCTFSDWYDTSSCIVPSSFTFGGSLTLWGAQNCIATAYVPQTTVDLCKSRTVIKYNYFNEANWDCTCM